MRYRIQHRTTYSGKEPVSVGQNVAWLRPRQLEWQVCEKFHLSITPAPTNCVERIDYFGNTATAFAFSTGYDELVVTATSEVTVRPHSPPEPEKTLPWEQIVNGLRLPVSPPALDAAQFRFDSPRASANRELADYARTSFKPERPILVALLDLTRRINADFKYKPQSTTVSSPVEEVFEKRTGVCQDFAHLQIAMLRSLGLAGRYVSGYLRTIPSPGRPRLIGADASHAWLSVYCGPDGWIDADPTNNLLPSADHVTIAWGRDYSDVPPIKGVYIGGGLHQLKVEVDVEPLPGTES